MAGVYEKTSGADAVNWQDITIFFWIQGLCNQLLWLWAKPNATSSSLLETTHIEIVMNVVWSDHDPSNNFAMRLRIRQFVFFMGD